MDIELVTDPDACMMYIMSPLADLGGGILCLPPTACLFWVLKNGLLTAVIHQLGVDKIRRTLIIPHTHRNHLHKIHASNKTDYVQVQSTLNK